MARSKAERNPGHGLAYFVRVLPFDAGMARVIWIALILSPFVYFDSCNPPVSSMMAPLVGIERIAE
jgi:hypothetical protein